MQNCNIETSEHISTITRMMFNAGIYLTIGTDFKTFKAYCGTQPDKGHVHPAFNQDKLGDREVEGIWIIGRGRSGEIVHTQAIRLIDLGEQTLKSHIAANLNEFTLHGYNLDLCQTEICMTRAAAQMRGCITYHGELWLKGGPNGIRGGSTVVLLTRLMLLMACERWSPDYMIGLQSPMTACRGLSTREGYARCEQRSILWYPKDGSEPIEDWLVWMNAEEAAFNLRLPPEYLDRLFAQPAYEQSRAEPMVA